MFGCSASIFLAMSCFSLFLLRVIMSTASGGKIGNSRRIANTKDSRVAS
jgi:hypothetical protein